MTLDELVEMALTIAISPSQTKLDRLRAAIQAHVRAAVAKEREACAAECDHEATAGSHAYRSGAKLCATRIRARGGEVKP